MIVLAGNAAPRPSFYDDCSEAGGRLMPGLPPDGSVPGASPRVYGGTRCASPHLPSFSLALPTSSQLLASLKITLTSQGSLLKCLLNVFPCFFFSVCFCCSLEFFFPLICVKVCNQNPICIVPVGNLVFQPLLYYLKCFYKFIATVGKLFVGV